jgi:hypothetical protein
LAGLNSRSRARRLESEDLRPEVQFRRLTSALDEFVRDPCAIHPPGRLK